MRFVRRGRGGRLGSYHDVTSVVAISLILLLLGKRFVSQSSFSYRRASLLVKLSLSGYYRNQLVMQLEARVNSSLPHMKRQTHAELILHRQ